MDDRRLRQLEDRPLVTLDNNALIALRRDELDAPAVRELLSLHRSELITINVTQSTALERQRAGEEMDMQAHRAWHLEQGIAPDRIFTASRSIGFDTTKAPGVPTFAPFLEVAAMQRVHEILSPTVPFMWRDYRDRECIAFVKARHASEEMLRKFMRAMAELDRSRYGVWIPPLPTPTLDAHSTVDQEAARALSTRLHRVWANKKHDALGLYNHITMAWHTTYPELAVFVTSDRNFRKPTKFAALRALGYGGEILPPAEAVAFLRTATHMLASAETGAEETLSGKE